MHSRSAQNAPSRQHETHEGRPRSRLSASAVGFRHWLRTGLRPSICGSGRSSAWVGDPFAAPARIAAGERLRAPARRRVHPVTRTSLLSNDNNPVGPPALSGRCQDFSPVLRLGIGLVFDELRTGNHRRARAAATSGGGALWRVLMRDQRRRRILTGPGRQRRHRAYVATFRFGKVQPSSPSACRAAASCPARHAS